MKSVFIKVIIIVVSFFFAFSASAYEETDSVWYDSISGVKMHIQQVDSFAKFTCPIHLFGKNCDGTCKSPALQSLALDLGINAGILAWDRFVQDRDYAYITNKVLKRNLTGGWVWDNDSFSGNQFAHPYHGGMFYNAAREHGLSYGVSLIYPLVGSGTWEVFCETNRPAINDFLSTGIGGAAIGEVGHRISDIFFDNRARGSRRVLRELLGTFLNPVRGFHRLVSGEMFHVTPGFAGKKEAPEPYSFEIGLGNRYTNDFGSVHPLTGKRYHENVPYLDITFNYGNHFNDLDEGIASRAYDYFEMYALMNLAPDNPTIGEFEITGRIGSIQRQFPHRWKMDIGFYQNLKYVDHYSNADGVAGNLAVISEAASFGAGFHAARQGKAVSVLHDFMFSAVPLGGSTADYYPLRRYNFGTGFSVRHKFKFIYNKHISFGNKFYFMRLFILKGAKLSDLENFQKDPEHYREEIEDGINAWGDKGEQSIIQNTLFFDVNITPDLRFCASSELYFRQGQYRYYPNRIARSHELKLGIVYAL